MDLVGLGSNAAPFTHCLLTLDEARPLPFWSLICLLGMIAVCLFIRMKWKTEIKHLLPCLTAYFRAGITLGAVEGRRLSFALRGTLLLRHFHPRFCDKHSHKESPWCAHKTARKCKANLSDSPRCCLLIPGACWRPSFCNLCVFEPMSWWRDSVSDSLFCLGKIWESALEILIGSRADRSLKLILKRRFSCS